MTELVEHLFVLKLEDWTRNTRWFELFLYSLGYDSFQVERIIQEFHRRYYGPLSLLRS